MPYLSACIRESQRLQPVAPALSRRTHQDISVGKTVIPKGTFVYVPIFLLHRDPKVYPDPECFRPERWIDETDVSKLKPTAPGSYFAFGGGPKMCVGFQLAEKEVKIAAAMVLQHYTILPTSDPALATNIVDRFVTGPDKVFLRFQKRTRSGK